MELTVKDIVRVFGVSERTVNTWIGKKDMPCVRANEQYRFNYIELLDWALENKVSLTPEVLALGDREERGPAVLYQALQNGRIHYDIHGDNREDVLRAIVDVLPLGPQVNRQALGQMLIAREKMMSTAVGNGIAIPHVRNPVVLNMDHPSVTLCFLKRAVDFKALDGKAVFVLFILLSPSVKQHLAVLSRLAFCLQNTKLQGYLHRKVPSGEILAEVRILESQLSCVSNGNGKGEEAQE